MSAKSIAKKAFKANAITEEEYKQLLCVIKLSDESLRQKGVWINAPTATFREVVAYECGRKSVERPHGEWIDTGYMEEYWAEEYRCSICGVKDHWHNFCPNCGAEMGKEEEND